VDWLAAWSWGSFVTGALVSGVAFFATGALGEAGKDAWLWVRRRIGGSSAEHATLRATASFDVARQLAKAAYEVRDSMANARAPVILGSEFPTPRHLFEKRTPQERATETAYVYSNRLGPVRDAAKKLDEVSREAEVLFGPAVRKAAEDLVACWWRLEVSVQAAVVNDNAGGEDFKADADFGRRIRGDLSRDPEGKDELSVKTEAAVKAIGAAVDRHLGK